MGGLALGFDWDDGNLEHCAKHGISRRDLEALFAAAVIVLPDRDHSQTERRFNAVGRTGAGRPVFVVFTVRERNRQQYIRPITARYMHREEIASYEEENPEL